jgi:hypothetical protein
MFSFLATTLLSSILVGKALAQGDITTDNNVTSLQGTWSSGSGAVSTGAVSVCFSKGLFFFHFKVV